MADYGYDFKNDKLYKLGINVGFFLGFLLFISAFYLIMAFFHKIPQAIKYYHVLFFVIIVYLIGFAIVKLKK